MSDSNAASADAESRAWATLSAAAAAAAVSAASAASADPAATPAPAGASSPAASGPFILTTVEADAKQLLASRTVWMVGVSAAAGILRAHGHMVSDADLQGAVTAFLEAVQYGAAGLAIAFRAMAKGPLK